MALVTTNDIARAIERTNIRLPKYVTFLLKNHTIILTRAKSNGTKKIIK